MRVPARRMSGAARPRRAAAVLGGPLLVVAVGAGCGVAPTGPADEAPTSSAPSPEENVDVQAAKSTLDRRAAEAPAEVASWGVDPGGQVVVVEVVGPRTPAVDRFLRGIDPRALRIEHVDRAPRLYDPG